MPRGWGIQRLFIWSCYEYFKFKKSSIMIQIRKGGANWRWNQKQQTNWNLYWVQGYYNYEGFRFSQTAAFKGTPTTLAENFGPWLATAITFWCLQWQMGQSPSPFLYCLFPWLILFMTKAKSSGSLLTSVRECNGIYVKQKPNCRNYSNYWDATQGKVEKTLLITLGQRLCDRWGLFDFRQAKVKRSN